MWMSSIGRQTEKLLFSWACSTIIFAVPYPIGQNGLLVKMSLCPKSQVSQFQILNLKISLEEDNEKDLAGNTRVWTTLSCEVDQPFLLQDGVLKVTFLSSQPASQSEGTRVRAGLIQYLLQHKTATLSPSLFSIWSSPSTTLQFRGARRGQEAERQAFEQLLWAESRVRNDKSDRSWIQQW